jgi:hypothetical protein
MSYFGRSPLPRSSKTRIAITVFSLAAWALNGTAARATLALPSPCPTADPKLPISWYDYLSHSLSSKPGDYPVGVIFNRNIGTIAAGHIYTVYWRPGDVWFAAGWNSSQRQDILDPDPNNSDEFARRKAPIQQHQMNVWGVPLQFNEAGEVFELYDKKFELVANLKCILY